MPGDKLDEIREKLRLDELDEKDKKLIFNKFVEAGGKVVSLDKAAKRGKETEYLRKEEMAKKQIEREIKKLEDNKRKTKAATRPFSSIIDTRDNPFNKWIERFSAKLGCILSGVLTLKGAHFRNSFRDLILNQYQNILLSSRMILASVLYQDKLIANEIKKRFFLDTVFQYNFELIFRFDNLYNSEIFEKLSVLRHSLQMVQEIKPTLLHIFKDIMILHPYTAYLKTAIEKALIMEKDLRRMEAPITYSNMHKLFSNVDFIFNRLYPRLFNLVDWYYKNDTIDRLIPFKDYLSFKEEDTIGYYTGKWKEELAAAAKKEEAEKAKMALKDRESTDKQGQPEGIVLLDDNDPIKKGLQIIDKSVKFQDILNEYAEKRDVRALFSINDRVFITYALIEFFDKEFSFIFNSNKVDFNVGFIEGKRVDLKREMSDIYYRLNTIFEQVNEYLKVIKDIKKLESDAYLSVQERSSRSNQYSIQRTQISRLIRREAKEFFELFAEKFLYILTDNSSARKIVRNPDQLLEFDKKLNGERYCDGKKVLDVVEDAYCFSSAAHFLLSDGDLSAYGLLIEKPVYINI